MLTIAVDAMGGDLGPRVAFKACENLLSRQRAVKVLLFVEQRWVDEAKRSLSSLDGDRVEIIGCGKSIAPDEKPKVVLRQRKSSSMAQALHAQQQGHCQGVLSVGSTGALMVLSRRILGVLPGIDRPALATRIPTRNKPLLLLDLGATLSATSRQLLQFAVLGTAWCRTMSINAPRVGLLNVGHESGKGTEGIRQASELLARYLPDCYAGFHEGDDLYRGELDVMVCDGFTGNVALKTSEGLTEWLIWLWRQEFQSHWFLKLLTPIWVRIMRRIYRRIAPARHGGAMLLGVDGVVVKTHGKSDASTYEHAMSYLVEQVSNYDRKALIDFIGPMRSTIA